MKVVTILLFTILLSFSEMKEFRDMTTMQLTRDMGIGINLGNTLES